MYQVNHVVKLEAKTFYDISVWNMFCKKKILSLLLLVIYGLGLGTVVFAIPYLKIDDTNGFILNGGIGVIMLIMTGYLLYSNINRLKRISMNEEQLAKTEKHIKMDEDQIINYRVSAEEQIVYKWSQVEGIYDRKGALILCMKDKQIIVLEKDKLREQELLFVKAKADVKMLWKKAFDARIWYAIIAAVTIIMALLAVYMLQA